MLGRREREEREVIPEPRGFFVRVNLGKTERNEAVQILLHEGDLVKKRTCCLLSNKIRRGEM